MDSFNLVVHVKGVYNIKWRKSELKKLFDHFKQKHVSAPRKETLLFPLWHIHALMQYLYSWIVTIAHKTQQNTLQLHLQKTWLLQLSCNFFFFFFSNLLQSWHIRHTICQLWPQIRQFIPSLHLSLSRINPEFARRAQSPCPVPSPEPQIYTVQQTVHHFWLHMNNLKSKLSWIFPEPQNGKPLQLWVKSLLSHIQSTPDHLLFQFFFEVRYTSPRSSFESAAFFGYSSGFLCMPHFNNALLPSTQLQAVPYSSS